MHNENGRFGARFLLRSYGGTAEGDSAVGHRVSMEGGIAFGGSALRMRFAGMS